MNPPPIPPSMPPTRSNWSATRDLLARPIGEVCQVLPGVLPMRCYSLAKPNLPSGNVLLQGSVGAAAPSVSDAMVERLLSALASIRNGNNQAAGAVTGSMTIREFRNLREQEQLAFINRIWNAVSTAHPFTQSAANMFDPIADDTGGNGPLPTSICPDSRGSNNFVKRLRGRQPFREFLVGFRVDGADNDSIARVTGTGMTQQRLSPQFMLSRRGLRLDSTVMADESEARVWTGNHDIFNETAVCVSRNFFGGTAFPERTTNGMCYLWAVNCEGLDGFDTEQYQLNLPGARQWRPGEKAFRFIPADHVLGYVRIDRRGAPPGGGWKVDIPADANWTFTGSPTVRQRAYMMDELAAWRGGSYTIPPEFDFAN